MIFSEGGGGGGGELCLPLIRGDIVFFHSSLHVSIEVCMRSCLQNILIVHSMKSVQISRDPFLWHLHELIRFS